MLYNFAPLGLCGVVVYFIAVAKIVLFVALTKLFIELRITS